MDAKGSSAGVFSRPSQVRSDSWSAQELSHRFGTPAPHSPAGCICLLAVGSYHTDFVSGCKITLKKRLHVSNPQNYVPNPQKMIIFV